MVRITSWIVVVVAALLAVGAATEGRTLPTAMWSLLGLSNLFPALGLDERSEALRKAGQVLSMVVFVLAIAYLYTLFTS